MKKYTWGTGSDVDMIENIPFLLPVENGKINFSFMEKFIAELEAYLLATGLKNYELTEQEKEALRNFNKTQFADYALVDIFDVKNTRSILSREIVPNSGTTPYLCASTEDNAVSSYVSYDEQYIDKGECIFIGGKTFVVTYQEKDFYSNDSHNLALYLKSRDKNKLRQLYLVSCVYKSLKHKYTWGDSISKAKIQHDKITLPTLNGKPDFETMETLISAVQKLVIKDVALYADREIAKTKRVVAKDE